MSAVVKAGGRAVAGIVGDVRFAAVIAVGVSVGGFLALWYFHEWYRGRKHVKLGIGRNPDVVPPPAIIKPPDASQLPGPKNGGVPAGDRPWLAGQGIRANVNLAEDE